MLPHVIPKTVVDIISFRAYIAASRRSDRSLEARLESARRASEIHKRRTGKALRVTEADVQNEEMYEEEDDLPASFHYGLGSSSFELRMRMQAYWEQQLALRNAMSFAAAGGNLNTQSQPPLSLRDYYQRFAQQYPLSLTSNQYLYPPPQIPTNMQPFTPVSPVVAPSIATTKTTSPKMTSNSNTSTSPTKSPVVGHHRQASSTTAPYSASNSQRNRRASSSVQPTEPQIHQYQPSLPAQVKVESIEYHKSPIMENVYTTQPYQSSISPFTTQLPAHMQQYNLADFVDPIPTIPAQSIPLDKLAATDDTADFFSNSNEWADFMAQSQIPSKITPYDDGTNWDDYLDGDANWLYNSQPEQDA